MSSIQTETKEGYALVTINRPETLNALDATLLSDISKTIDTLTADRSLVGAIWTGTGKAFVAGADISKMKDMTKAEAEVFSELGQSTFRKLELSRLVSLAALNGFTLGGGLELALACDFRFASDKAKLGLPEVSLGLLPGFGGTQRLTRLVGSGIASQWIFSGEMFSAEDSLRFGVVNRVSPAESLIQEAESVMKTICSRGANAIENAKKAIRLGQDSSLDQGLQKEKLLFAGLFETAESKEGLQAFLEKRKPNFAKESK